MIGLLILASALSMFAPMDKTEAPAEALQPPCYPDTVEVVGQQFLGCDTVYVMNAIPIVRCRVILCVPDGVDLENR